MREQEQQSLYLAASRLADDATFFDYFPSGVKHMQTLACFKNDTHVLVVLMNNPEDKCSRTSISKSIDDYNTRHHLIKLKTYLRNCATKQVYDKFI